MVTQQKVRCMVSSVYEGRLRPSSNAGRYEVGVDGPDLTAGEVCEVWVGGQWMVGEVWHSKGRVDEMGLMSVERPRGVYGGYYLVLADAQGAFSVCGLCT